LLAAISAWFGGLLDEILQRAQRITIPNRLITDT